MSVPLADAAGAEGSTFVTTAEFQKLKAEVAELKARKGSKKRKMEDENSNAQGRKFKVPKPELGGFDATDEKGSKALADEQ